MFHSMNSYAWGRRGHALVAESAAYLMEEPYFKDLSVDMGFYNVVPDAIWKSLKEKKIEQTEHFMDIEVYERAKATDWDPDRRAFLKKHPVPVSAGRAIWRISELEQDLRKITLKMNATTNVEARKRVQGDWQKMAGILGHYVADLSQPLHVTENHDGQLTGQAGLHGFYETDVVNELYPGIGPEVHQRVGEIWKTRSGDLKKKDAFRLSIDLMNETRKEIPGLLESDKKIGRDLEKAKSAYRERIVNELALGSVYLAAIWIRNLPEKIETHKVYEFRPNPAYIFPHEVKK